MVSDVHYVRIKGDSELHTIREWNWKGQSITYYNANCGKIFIMPFSSVEFMLDSDPEVENMKLAYLYDNY
jgi:hypothetical protein